MHFQIGGIGGGALGSGNVAKLDPERIDVEIGKQEVRPLLRDRDRQRAFGTKVAELVA
jgi:hypothetical protein